MGKLTKKELKERRERVTQRLKDGWSIEAIAEAEGLKSPNELKWPPDRSSDETGDKNE